MPRDRDWLDYLDTLGKWVMPVVVLVLGFQINGSVQQALQARRLELESGRAIEELLSTLYGTVSTHKAGVAALTLASYGQASILPLIGVLEHGSPEAEGGAESALLTVGLSHQAEVCSVLSELIAKRRGQFKWSTHRTAIRVLGQLECEGALGALEAYADVVAAPPHVGAEPWAAMVKNGSVERYGQIREELQEALAALGIRRTFAETGGSP